MDWFKQNKIKIGGILGSLALMLKQANLSTNAGYNLALDIVVFVAGTLTGTGTNIKSDKQERVTAEMRAVDPTFIDKRK